MSLAVQPDPSFSNRTRWRIAANVFASLAAVLALVIMANYLAARHFTRTTWMAENPYQLTRYTQALLHSLTNRVKIVILWNRDNDPYGLFSSVSGLLTEYALGSPKIAVQYVDQIRNPAAALRVKESYRLSLSEDDVSKNIVLFECNKKLKTVYEKDLYDLDFSGPLSGKSREVKRSNFKGELVFTSALVSVTDPKEFRAYFLEGHKEHDPQDDTALGGYSKFGRLLQELNVQVVLFGQLRDTDLPADCSLLIVAGPEKRFEAAELTRIDQYLNRGGRLLALFKYPQHEPTGLERVLLNWGVKVGHDEVLDLKSLGSGGTQGPLIITNYSTPGHPIIRPLLRSALELLLPRTVAKQQTGKPDADSARVDELAMSGRHCIAAANTADVQVTVDLDRDPRGPLPLIAAVEKGSVPGVAADRGVTRMVIVGDSYSLGNQLLDAAGSANRDFAVLAVNWLLDRSRLMGGIGPRPVHQYQVLMSNAQMTAVRWVLLGVLPGSVMVLGLLVWFRRRK